LAFNWKLAFFGEQNYPFKNFGQMCGQLVVVIYFFLQFLQCSQLIGQDQDKNFLVHQLICEKSAN